MGELWERMSQWYIDNGIAEIVVVTKGNQKKEKLDFICEPSRGDDKYIKASKLLHQRFLELFPKIKKERDYSHGDRHGLFYLAGIGFGSPVGSPAGSPMDQQKPLQGAVDHQGSPVSPTLSDALKLIAKLTPIEREFLVSRLKGVQLVIHDDPRLYERVAADPSESVRSEDSAGKKNTCPGRVKKMPREVKQTATDQLPALPLQPNYSTKQRKTELGYQVYRCLEYQRKLNE